MTKTIERSVADTILCEPTTKVIAGKRYTIKPQSLKTLITVSAMIAELPTLSLKSDDILSSSLGAAKDCYGVSEIIATLILGVENLLVKEVKNDMILGVIPYRREVVIDQRDRLADEIESLTPSEIYSLTIEVLKRQEIADFFALTTSLVEVNILQATMRKTTLSGQ